LYDPGTSISILPTRSGQTKGPKGHVESKYGCIKILKNASRKTYFSLLTDFVGKLYKKISIPKV
jgi:hypothetical protein